MPAHFPLSASAPSLKFPRPQGSQRLANWISSSSPDIMSPPSSVSGVVVDDPSPPQFLDFEMINPDFESESQDGSATESVTSSLGPSTRPEDTDSLADTDDRDDHTHPAESSSASREDGGDEPSLGLASNGSDTAESPSTGAPYNASHPSVGPTSGDSTTHGSDVAKHLEDKALVARSGPTRNIYDLLGTQCLEPWPRWVCFLTMVVIFFGAIAPALLPTPLRSGEATKATTTIQAFQAPVTVPPTSTTVTITVTSTSTVRLNSIHNLAWIISHAADKAANTSEFFSFPDLRSMAGRLWNTAAGSDEAARDGSLLHLSSKIMHRLMKPVVITATRFRRHNKQEISHQLELLEALKDDLSFSVLKAQISSWLVCLQILGDKEEYRRYEARATEHLKAKHREIADKRAGRAPQATVPSPRGLKFRWNVGE